MSVDKVPKVKRFTCKKCLVLNEHELQRVLASGWTRRKGRMGIRTISCYQCMNCGNQRESAHWRPDERQMRMEGF